MQPEQFLTHSLQDRRIARVLHAAIKGVDPAALTARALRQMSLPPHHRRFLLGLGKAAEAMTQSAADALGSYEAALVITKHRSSGPRPRWTVLEAGHPVPDVRSLAAGRAALDFVARLREDDVLICLVSGGGSALVTVPVSGLSLEDLQDLTSAALATGAGIEEVNVLRRQLDQVKGGGLAASNKGSTISLILSDVIGDRLEAIASGPTAPNPTGSKDALAVVRKYRMRVPASIERALGADKVAQETPSPDRVRNIIVGNGALAVSAALEQACREGFTAEVLDTHIRGEARDVGRALADRLVTGCSTGPRPFCLVGAGETTVTLNDHGRGGRNQELALAAVDALDNVADCMLISLATDGDDGPTDAAGAVATGESSVRAAGMGMQASHCLDRHDAYSYFEALGDLLKPGYTGTNVNDLILLLGL